MSERIPVRMAFVILHYNSIDETRECIRSIRVLNAWPGCAAVVVDNASPNGTGKILAEEYAGTDRVEVILNGTNAGFSAGNNAGYRFALEKYDPAFITICNNDVVFPEADYVAQVEAAYAESSFDVLGPDIFQTRLKIHQSPLGLKAPGTAEVRRTILLNTLAKQFFPLFWMLFGKKELRRIANRGDAENWNEVMRDVPLMGACLVFSGRFTQRRGKGLIRRPSCITRSTCCTSPAGKTVSSWSTGRKSGCSTTKEAPPPPTAGTRRKDTGKRWPVRWTRQKFT